MGGQVFGWQRRFRLDADGVLSIERVAPGGALRRITVEFDSQLPGAGLRPHLVAVADANCTIRLARRLVYDDPSGPPVALEILDASLATTGNREPLNPPVPSGSDPGGVAVALVDAGVDYRIPAISRRLARDENGDILGYDYWDLDHRPFDANPARSPFFPQRHGTETASVLLSEAPGIRLVPYRYPRPDMSRMTELVDDAAAHGIRIMNLSMGSDDANDWTAFATAARAHPDMLFVFSAGNDGRDIDARPVYPAALSLDNAITVTSSEDDGGLARGSNWGEQSVDLLVPAERLSTTGFDGNEVGVSGSSFAAVRISALAARFLAPHPDWSAPELKAAILARVLPNFAGRTLHVRAGFIPRPDTAELLPPLHAEGTLTQTTQQAFSRRDLYSGDENTAPRRYGLDMTWAYLKDTAWDRDTLTRLAREAAKLLSQCGISIERIDVRQLDGPDVFRYFHDEVGQELVRRLALPKPTVYFVRDTIQVVPFDAEAIGKGNSASRPGLRYTIWMTEATRDPGIALAHELAHLLMDSGRHVEEPGNLMRAETAPGNTKLSDSQCEAMVGAGAENGLLVPVDE